MLNTDKKEFELLSSNEIQIEKYEPPDSKIIGYTDKLKSDKFKIADLKIDRVGGAVCSEHSKPKAVNEFTKRVDKKLYTEYIDKEKLGRSDICNILEYILRDKDLKDDGKKYFFRYYLNPIPPLVKK